MKMELTRRINEQAFEVVMEMGIDEKREEILAVLKLSESGRISRERLNRELLNRNPNSAYGERILKNMEDMYGLISRIDNRGNYELTDQGKYSLENDGDIFIPELGYYLLYTTDDPLMKERIIGYDLLSSQLPQFSIYASRLKASDFKREIYQNRERRKKMKNGEEFEDNFINLPKWLLKDRTGEIITLHLQNGEVIQIYKIEPQGCQSNRKIGASIHLEFDEQENLIVNVKNKDRTEKRVIESNFNKSFEETLKELLGPEGKNLTIIDNNLTLLVSFSDLTTSELTSFQISRKLNKPTLKDFGSFDNTVIYNIPIFPKTEKDAIKWGDWLIQNEINYYMDNQTFEKIRENIANRFSVKFNIHQKLKDFNSMLNYFKEQKIKNTQFNNQYWYLQAPVDLVQEGEQ